MTAPSIPSGRILTRRTVLFLQLVYYFFFAVPQLLDLAAGAPAYTYQHGFIVSQFDRGTNVVYLRGVDLKAPKTGRDLSQLQALFFAPAEGEGKTVDFFQFISTAPAEHMDRFGPAFMEMVGSFRFA